MNSLEIPSHKLKRFVKQLCIAAKRYDEEITSAEGIPMGREQVLREIGILKSNLDELQRNEKNIYRISREGEIIIADLRRRLRDMEARVAGNDSYFREQFNRENDRIAFLTQSMDNLKDRLAMLGNLRKTVTREEEAIKTEEKDISQLKSRIEALEIRLKKLKKSGKKATVEKLSKRLSDMKRKLP
ncbi:MAG TPA: hypothetical protein VJI46_05105 [Candidatus Nanoarchaeia archaeon]|nr:hypothetical protein [Candidatus Nanoarchaeia archaeon]